MRVYFIPKTTAVVLLNNKPVAVTPVEVTRRQVLVITIITVWELSANPHVAHGQQFTLPWTPCASACQPTLLCKPRISALLNLRWLDKGKNIL